MEYSISISYLQQSLIKLGYNPGPIDGIFGSATQLSVKLFQKTKGLIVDGIVGNITWDAINKALQNPPTPNPIPTPTKPILKIGSTGAAVRSLQQSLIKLGYNSGQIDGIFGSATQSAVKLFQKNKGLIVDGIVGNATWDVINKALQKPPNPNPTPTPTKPILKIGSTGEAVTYLQQSLTNLGYNPGPVDGIFGSATQSAVKSFQKNKGLIVDGIVGSNTWAALDNPNLLKFNINMFANIQTVGTINKSGINDCTIGTVGQSKRIEAIAITIDNIDLKYNVYIQDIGDIIGKIEGQFEGTMDQSKRIEAITIFAKSIPSGYKLQYQVYVQTIGWQAFKESGQLAGTQGKSLQIEALRIKIVVI
ncbi:MAG: peptidoglycan-binding protein [Clostridium sp.]|uniref:peptidoglycan-binding protein n=1 Tax=Clostridium sp. TaxID=1506 RepID=UPI003D6C7498